MLVLLECLVQWCWGQHWTLCQGVLPVPSCLTLPLCSRRTSLGGSPYNVGKTAEDGTRHARSRHSVKLTSGGGSVSGGEERGSSAPQCNDDPRELPVRPAKRRDYSRPSRLRTTLWISAQHSTATTSIVTAATAVLPGTTTGSDIVARWRPACVSRLHHLPLLQPLQPRPSLWQPHLPGL